MVRIAHHLAKSDLLHFEINVHMCHVFDHALFPCSVVCMWDHDTWLDRTWPTESHHAIGGLVIRTQSGIGMWPIMRILVHTLLIRSHRRVVCCLISNVVLCLECRNGRDPTSCQDGMHLRYTMRNCEQKLSLRRWNPLQGSTSLLQNVKLSTLTSNPTLWAFLPALRKEDNLIDLLWEGWVEMGSRILGSEVIRRLTRGSRLS